MAKKPYDETSVIKSLLKKRNSIKIDSVNKTVKVNSDHNEVGNKSWGKIDYLRKIHGYIVGFYSNQKVVIEEENDSSSITNKSKKRKNKFDMVNMTKTAMRNAKTK